jgi:hypothetical protein
MFHDLKSLSMDLTKSDLATRISFFQLREGEYARDPVYS